MNNQKTVTRSTQPGTSNRQILSSLVTEIDLLIGGHSCRHCVIVGRPGSGKTVLLDTLTNHFANRPQVTIGHVKASPYFVTTYKELISTIGASIGFEDSLNADEIVERLEHPTRNVATVIVVEDLDLLYRNIGEIGQRSFGALLQQCPNILIIGSATRTIAELFTVRTKRFVEFELDELTAGHATELIEHHTGFGLSDRGRSRVEAIHHLIGGLPRDWVNISRTAHQNKLLDVAECFELVSAVTNEAFRFQLNDLSAAKAKVLMIVATTFRGAPMNVTDIATVLDTTNQIVSKQIGDLDRAGLVQKIGIAGQDKRQTFYEITNPTLLLSKYCATGTSIVDHCQIVEAWFDTRHRQIAAALRSGRKATPIDSDTLPVDVTEEEQHVVAEHNTAINERNKNGLVDTINKLGSLRDNPASGRFETAIQNALWEYCADTIKQWPFDQWLQHCEQDLAMLHDAARPDMVLRLLRTGSADNQWINLACNLGYEPHIAGILRGLATHPKQLQQAAEEISLAGSKQRTVTRIAQTLNNPPEPVERLPAPIRRLATELLANSDRVKSLR
jgi:Holliday junction resolvasome RuvABC ATP-dependent DNA helicase subunit